MTSGKLTTKQIHAIKIEEALGKLVLLSIGIDDYDEHSGFKTLKTSVNDAVKIRDTFLDVHQLNADKDRVFCLTSKSNTKPSKGEIIKTLKKTTAMANKSDRFLFYYSGHGQRINKAGFEKKFYLVPQDVYDSEDPDALVDFDKILEIIEECDAKQKIIVLDACFSGPELKGAKFLPAMQSKKFYIEYLKETKGTFFLSSSASDQLSFTQSPNPKLSLFTCFMVKALNGDPKSLDNSLLTLNSLYDYLTVEMKLYSKSCHLKQNPSISQNGIHIPVLGDFNKSIISPDQLDLNGMPISEISFYDFDKIRIAEILTSIKYYHKYSVYYLEGIVNKQLDEYLEDDFSAKASKLRKALELTSEDVYVENSSIMFPDGSLTATFKGNDNKSGIIEFYLNIGEDWFGNSTAINNIIEALSFVPNSIVFELKKKISPLSLIPGLESKGWKIISENNKKVIAENEGYIHEFTDYKITFSGFTPKELFGIKTNEGKLAASIFSLLS